MKFALFFLQLAFISLAFSARAIDVSWLQADFKPCHFVDGSEVGYCDEIDALIFQQLPRFSFHSSVESIPRFLSRMDKGEFFCTSNLLWTQERATKLEYSIPVHYIIPAVAVTQRDNQKILGLVEEGLLDVDKLLALDVSIGIRNKRYYGAQIQRLIDTYPNREMLYVSNLEMVTTDMLKGGRLDITFLNPAELPLYDTDKTLKAIPVKDAGLSPVHVSCTKSAEGIRVVFAINQAIRAVSAKALSEPYEKRLPDYIRPHYRAMFTQVQQGQENSN